MSDVKRPAKIACPQCGGKLHLVERGANSPLNRDQFDAVKAGDYFCEKCPANDRGQAPFCYWWEHELPRVDPKECPHTSFGCEVDVNRIVKDENDPASVPFRFMADVRVNCVQCGEPFRFIGLPAGMDYNSPMVSVDGCEGRFPVHPKCESLSELEGGPQGFTVRRVLL